LGKIKDISAASLTEDGAPLLIVDVEDMLRSLEKLASADRLAHVGHQGAVAAGGAASVYWWSTIPSPCVNCNANCSTIMAMRSKWRLMAWMAGMRCVAGFRSGGQ
jgi:hypothetical protein